MTNRAILTQGELGDLAELVGAERARIKKLIADNPTNTTDNQTREAYIAKLDLLAKRLKESLGEPAVQSDYKRHDKITEATLQPVTKAKSKLDKELQEWEVQSTKDGQDSLGE